MKKALLTFCLLLGTTAAQQGPATTSTLTGIRLTPGAIRVTDAGATRELGQYLNTLAKDQGSGCQTSEYLVWDDPDLAEQISDDLASAFQARKLVFKTLSEEEEEEAYSLSFLLTQSPNRFVGMLFMDSESVVLGWCHLKAAAQQAAPAAPAVPATQPRPAAPTSASQQAGQQSGSAPRPGHYRGELVGDFKGNAISFQVAADGKIISNVQMTGYWRCSDSLSNTTYKTNPRLVSTYGAMPGTVPVKGGLFSAEAKQPYLLWDVSGRFVSPTTAQGTFMVQSNDCTSYKLTFTATRQ
ncbi:hypothetical protein DEDE109153_02620 [Deinococcus deserti]|uniref:Uncharacterized protein n=1 Tax=Deinococcus deserti (strain DSM 17065 / CIP 109153 / LMG 22923 / VCD115) TaxID=546414 RepID=C1CUT7_DEIDV|nr:hypothetical protein [Deinococcus deserti]ACO45954.1 Hypothetical protein, precursor [Deinococcus deserti VCD115]